MHQHLEVELKWQLTAKGHASLARRLAETLGPAQVLEQDNRFFDSVDLRLRQAWCNVRLRAENGRTLLTCKRRAAGIAQAHVHDEWEVWLDDGQRRLLELPGADLASLLPLPDPVRLALAGARLVPLGGFSNRRLEQHDGADLLCLDCTRFPGGRVDYELEIETATPADTAARWSSRLAQWGVAHQPQPLTKFARYLGKSRSLET